MIDNFEEVVNDFIPRITNRVYNWKRYFGAAYSTRVRYMIKEVREQLDALEDLMDRDDET
jgi:uncharacterized protein YaaR (DUF327 family)